MLLGQYEKASKVLHPVEGHLGLQQTKNKAESLLLETLKVHRLYVLLVLQGEGEDRQEKNKPPR